MIESEGMNPAAIKRLEYRFGLPHLALLAAAGIYLVILAGVVSRAVSGPGCPDWPACFGVWSAPPELSARVDYLHRAASALAVALTGAAAVLAWRNRGASSLVGRSLALALGLLLVQAGLGGAAILSGNWNGALHMGLALVTQSLAVAGAAAAYWQSIYPEADLRLRFQSPFGRLSLLAMGSTLVVMISGAALSGSGMRAACAEWPVCLPGLLAGESGAWLAMSHRLVVAASGVFVAALLIRAWQTQRSQTAILAAATVSGVLFIVQSLMGSVNLAQGFAPHLVGIHAATSAGIWACLSLTVVLAGLAGRTGLDEQIERQAGQGRSLRRLALDFLLLTKPIVVALLLVTTYAGMVIGAQAWPDFGLAFWTLLGGFMAAGGSGAINQYIDRLDDERMQRTANRPIPSGRLTPGEGLAFGLAISLASFFLLTVTVNLLAALLSLAGIFYYVVLYSLILKKTTVQNIVIGGGAGAIPPLVGWAAATGSLTIPSLLLFAVVFMWTPPHFWALALVRRKDYARAGVPMLPVVRGEAETRWQVFLYTLELVGLTLLLPLFGLGSSLYLIAAALLGGLLLLSAYRVWKGEGNKIAWKMYRHSSMYLAFLFLALMVDRLLL
jgi:protoheme IX farnesyltransferase